MSTKLAKQTQKTAGIGNGLRTATVAAVTQQGVMLNINGTIVGPFASTAAFSPLVGSAVSVFRQDSTWLIMGHANPVSPQYVTGVYTPTAAPAPVRQPSGFINYPVPYPVGTKLAGFPTINGGAGGTSQWFCDWVPQDETRFQLFFMNPVISNNTTPLAWSVIVFPVG